MRNFSKIITVGIMFLMFLGCNKEEVLHPEQNQSIEVQIDETTTTGNEKYPEISFENGVLEFESIAYYESIVSNESENYNVDELVSYLNSTTFESYGKTFGERSEYEEPFMDAIMNKDKIVKIGEWFIYIDIPSETVLVLSDEEENAYQALLEKSNLNIRAFSIGDDVLDILVNNTSSQGRGCGGIGGGTYSSDPKVVGSIGGGININLYAGVTFFRAGVYFRLSSLYQLAPYSSSMNSLYNVEVQVTGSEGWRKRKPCNGSSVGTIATNTITICNSYGSGQDTFYSGTRNLNGYYFYVRARCTNCQYEDENDDGWTNSGGRNINSPY